MTVPSRKPLEGTYDKCLAITTRDGRTHICYKSPGHEKSADAAQREHCDPTTNERWTK